MIAAYLASVAAFALFALSQAPHWSAALRRPPPSRRAMRAMRAAAWSSVIVALALSVGAEGPAFGALAWVALLVAGAATVAAALTVRAGR